MNTIDPNSKRGGDLRPLVVVPRWSKGLGGVANYYRVLSRVDHFSKWYFETGSRTEGKGTHLRMVGVITDAGRLLCRLVTQRPRVVHLNPSLMTNALIREGLFLLIAKFCRRKVLVFWRGWNPRVDAGLAGWKAGVFRRVFGLADAHLVLAASFRERLRELGVTAPIDIETTVVPTDWLDNFRERKHAWPGRRPVRVLFLSRLETKKGLYDLIEASRLLHDRELPIQVIIAGEGSEAERLAGLLESKQPALANFVGYIEGRRKAAAYRWADIYVLPSRGEGMPNSVLEAMGAGCAVIATPVGGLADLFDRGPIGISISEPDAHEIAAAIAELVDNPAMFREISRFSRAYIARTCTAEAVHARLWTHYRRVAER